MKMKIKNLLILPILLLVLFVGCSKTMNSPDNIINEIKKLPQDYTIAQAKKDGFVVINSTLNAKNREIDDFIENFYSKDKQLIIMDEKHIVNFYQINNAMITLFSFDVQKSTIIHQAETFDRIEINEFENKAELSFYDSKGKTETSTGEKHIVYIYHIK